MLKCRCHASSRPAHPLHCNLPITSISFSSLIKNSICHLSIIQTFKNSEENPIECEYSFPTSEDSAITSLKFHLPDSQVIKAVVRPSEEASEVYQDEISKGNTPALGKLNDLQLTLIVGNLGPGESVRVESELVCPLESDESYWKFSFPSLFYLKSGEFEDVAFSLAVNILNSSPIQTYSSNSQISWELSEDKKVLQGRSDSQTQQFFKDTQIWVKFKSANTNSPSLLVQKAGNKYAAMLSFVPFCDSIESLDDVDGKGEFFFVLDRSGSMNGDRIEMAKQAAVLFLKSLPRDSLFNIVSFGSKHLFLFKKSRKISSEIIDETIQLLSKFSADLGGTEIYKPLEEIFSLSLETGYPRTVFLLTDGEFEYPTKVIKLIERNSGSARVHSFGIGEDVDFNLLEKCAKAGKGSAKFITKNEEISKEVVSALRKCVQPCIGSWKASWQGECYPPTEKLGNLYFGERCIQYILLDQMPSDAVQLSFYDNFKGSFQEFSLSEFEEVSGDSIYKLWAKAKLDYLNFDSEKNEEEMIRLSVESGVPTEFTSFILVKENDEPVLGEIAFRKAKSMKNSYKTKARRKVVLNKTSRGLSSVNYALCGSNADRSMISCSTRFSQLRGLDRDRDRDRCNRSYRGRGSPVKASPTRDLKRHKKSKSRSRSRSRSDELSPISNYDATNFRSNANDDYLKIISNFEIEGFWKYEKLCDGFTSMKRIPEDLLDHNDKFDIYSTLFMLALLHKRYDSKFEEWILIEKKTLRWLKSKGVEFKDLKELISGLIT